MQVWPLKASEHSIDLAVKMTATVVVRRPPGGYRDAMRRYKVRLDGKVVGKLTAGSELRVDVPPGEHTLQGTIDWSGSEIVRFVVTEDHVAIFHLAPAGSAVSFCQAFTSQGYLKLLREDGFL
ncbi:hypothetical protein [Pseudokineococcus sp. 1T1Z-3]|uniref:hypothetical protein n=1 Tax=Pseudokineococcus sp. 1T1Z-3 TaxID=3132745 RepID=UPI0030AE857C